MPVDRFAEIAGGRIRYRIEGAGPAVVLIHGLGAFVESWNWTVPALRERHTTITFDFPGFGMSDPIDAAFDPEGAAAFVLSFMDALDVRRAALIGSSLGGAIATLAAGVAPHRCTALVLVAPAGFGTRATVAARLAALPIIGEGLVAAIRHAPGLGARHAFIRRHRVPRPLIDAARRAFTRGQAGSSCLRIIRATVTMRGVRPEIVRLVRDAASRVTAPTMVVWGTADRVIPATDAVIVVRSIANAEMHLVHGAGHVAFIEEAETFNALVGEFLARTRRPTLVGAPP